MKNFLTLILLFISSITFSQSTCGSPITLANGACITNRNWPGTDNMTGLCVSSNNPSLYINIKN